MADTKKSGLTKPNRCCNTNSDLIGYWIAIGAGIGTAMGAAFNNIPVGVALGPGLGFLFGMYLDKRKRSEQAGSSD